MLKFKLFLLSNYDNIFKNLQILNDYFDIMDFFQVSIMQQINALLLILLMHLNILFQEFHKSSEYQMVL